MNGSLYRNFGLLGAAIACFAVSQLLQFVSFNSMNERGRVRRFEKTLQKKELLLYSVFEGIEGDLQEMGEEDYFTFLYPEISDRLKGEGMDVYLFRKDSLVCWTGNTVSTANFDADRDVEIIFLGNNWSVKKERVSGEIRMVGLIKIKNEYPYENIYLRNNFQKDFRVPPGTRIIPNPVESAYPVHDYWQKELFSLDFSGVPVYSRFQSHLSLVLFFLGILLFLFFVRRLIRSIPGRTRKNTGIYLAALTLVLLDGILMKIPVAPNMEGMDIFNPQLFAASDILPSLGDLLITSVSLFFLVYIFYYEFRPGEKRKGAVFTVFQAVFFLALVFYFQGIVLLFRSLVVHSSISFETYRVLDISIFTFLGFFILGLHFAAFSMLADRFFSLFGKAKGGRRAGLAVLVFGLLSWVAGYLQAGGPDPVLILLVMTVAGLIAWARYTGRVPMSYSTYVLLIFLFSVISVYQVSRYSNEKRHNEKLVLAVDLSAEHDPVAELLLKNMEEELAGDQELAYLIHEGYTDQLVIDDYLRGNYFSGFWEKYDMHFTLCSPYDSLYVEPFVDTWYPCYEFFEELYADSRYRIPGSRFYFVDNMNGRVSYFGSFTYYSADSTQEAGLFLELDSRLVSAELGYPELLLRDRPRKGFFTQNYSYAKYSQGQLITQNGEYSYSLKPDPYSDGRKEFEYTTFDGYEHLAYNLDENNIIVVSNPKISLLNLAITFTYIFVFFYLVMTLYLLLANIRLLKSSLQLSIKNKIQYTVIGILLLSLLLIGGGTILFSIRQYKERHHAILAEKIQSVYLELDHRLEFEDELDRDWQEGGYLSLDELLEKLSNVFFTDINLYDPQGELLATSRSEVFENKLLGPRIQPAAFRELSIRHAARYVQEENIGSLRYLSAYVPFRNNRNKLLAYLNLPYFTRQRVLTSEISNLVIAIVNFYVLLITVSILIAVVLSTQITQPLRMLQSKFGKVAFGGTNEKIRYDAGDEIGGLVREYNRMVDQLAVSAEKLARSERESAWREMAKQIAHEIKNPLTPMKLSVQHLERSLEKDPENQKENIRRITRTLIDQIDNLSTIATEFSNFAKMPRANNEEVDLAEKLAKISELFMNTEQVGIETRFMQAGPVMVFADREQLSRVFINLLKNAIQSVPEDREGKIGISLETDNEKAVVRVTDNGRGIPAELSDKLFRPNFTTKSSGMGMGLAIVKSIVENAGGSIRFETELGEGTTFIVELPLSGKQGD